MRRVLTALIAVAVVASVATAVLVWQLSRHHGPDLPEISAYSHGNLTRVGPYRFCQVLNPTDCVVPAEQGQLPVNRTDPVQVSLPSAIADAPWVLLRVYEDDSLVEEFRPGTRLAVTIPTVDPFLGRLTGVAVHLPTLVRDEDGNEFPVPHAEWSVRTVWP
ncbi:hypothetical protein CRI77_04060 [Mycolicibacterium duvalii]|uniref:Uncharacterized protein n=1 Tax=Mycolicibacterium duvalii TaxID=39688 RepID=A0A7I7K9X4_9MYCO|nr:DUF2771 domain-containing protein [Mycolicibacterium duvalii]MCV7366451.1 DUF2771 domain-containing protein [Mycolicibacterium duvalii]PEG43762.1 hypothetical protein CRI77_04060 [Mycolicibacterium duvalii]BBX20278.1 hypothetical protein MDUV_51380 [Mycolicibacterium duvalii]